MKRLTKYLKGYVKETILGPLFKLFEATLELIVPLVVASIVDRGIGAPDKTYTLWMCLLLVLLGLVGLGFSVTAQYFSAKASVGFITKVKHALYSHIQSLSYSDMDTLGTSTMITRMTADSAKVQTGLNLALRLLLRSPFIVFGAMIMAFYVDPRSGATFAGVIPVLAVIVFGIMLITMPMYKSVQSGTDKLLRKTRENLSGVRVIRAFGKESDEIAGFKKANETLTNAQKRAGGISALLNPLTYVVINLGILLLIEVGALQVNAGDLTQGEVIALYNYMSQILIELIKLANLIISITKALASASRIASVFDIKSSQVFGELEKMPSSEIAVEFDSVSLKYAGAAENSIESVTFSARVGETVGIIGGTGSGKSTLINMIPRFYDATEGEVRLFGKNISEFTKDALCREIGVVPQKAVLFSGSIRDNLKWGNADATDEEIYSALRIAQAAGVVDDKGGLDGKVLAGGKNFSGGQRQRLTVARALVKNPGVLILDDSASALDFATDAEMRRMLRESCSDKTVFIVSQRAASVMYADKIIVLDDGRVDAIGTHDELMENSEVYREIYDSQFKKEVS